MQVTILLSIISFFLSLTSVFLIKKVLSRQLIDIPNERSSHTQPTPRGGGLGFILAFAITITISYLLGINSVTPEQYIAWLALVPLVAVGIIDDWKNVPSGIRYLIQLFVSFVVVADCGAFPLPILGELGSTGELIASLLTIIAMTALINFYNFMDGLDGLVGGVTALQLGFVALWFNQSALWILIAALLGFLYWNWSPAKIFMGDAGSTFLGGIIAIAFLSYKNNPTLTWSGLAILLPLIGDAIYTLFRRLLRGENIFKAHRSHLYQRLQQSGWSHSQVAIAYILITVAIGVIISSGETIGAWSSLIGTVIAVAGTEVFLQTRKLSLK